MKRWLFASAAVLAAASTAAQIVREAPADVRPGRMAVTTPPEITLDGKTDRLSPGARIRDTRNMLVLSGSLAGQTVPVVYRRDAAGLVHEVWLLTAEEYDKLASVGEGTENARRLNQVLGTIFGTRR